MSGGAFAADFLIRIAQRIRNRPKAVARRARKAARKAATNKPSDELAEEFNSTDDKETAMLNGYKTYLGIITAAVGFVLGLFGIGDSESSALSAQLVGALDQILTVGGLLFAAYGRAKATPSA